MTDEQPAAVLPRSITEIRNDLIRLSEELVVIDNASSKGFTEVREAVFRIDDAVTFLNEILVRHLV